MPRFFRLIIGGRYALSSKESAANLTASIRAPKILPGGGEARTWDCPVTGQRPQDKSSAEHTPVSAAEGVEQALKVLEGRWKLMILFHLFGGKLLRLSELERAIPAIS